MGKEWKIPAAADSAECSADITDQSKRRRYIGKNVRSGQGCYQKRNQQAHKIHEGKTRNAIYNIFPSRPAVELDAKHAVRM